MINELIKKYIEKINEINTISKSEKKICEEIISDLEQLKDKIYGSNDYTLMIHLKKEIIGE